LWRRLEGGIAVEWQKQRLACYWRAPIGHVYPVIYCPKAALCVGIGMAPHDAQWLSEHELTVIQYGHGEVAKALDAAVRWVQSTARELARKRQL
jgi:hypothetical protein